MTHQGSQSPAPGAAPAIDRLSLPPPHLPNKIHDPVQVIWFRQKSGSLRQLIAANEDISRRNYDANPRPAFPHAMRQFQSVHGSRHPDIGEQDIDGLGARFADVESGRGIFGRKRRESLIFQGLDRERAQQSFIFCDHRDKRSFGRCGQFSHHEEGLPDAKVPPLCLEPYI
jgi:hypothetical protein